MTYLPFSLRAHANKLSPWATESDIKNIQALATKMSIDDAIRLTKAGITNKDPIPSEQALRLLEWGRKGEGVWH